MYERPISKHYLRITELVWAHLHAVCFVSVFFFFFFALLFLLLLILSHFIQKRLARYSLFLSILNVNTTEYAWKYFTRLCVHFAYENRFGGDICERDHDQMMESSNSNGTEEKERKWVRVKAEAKEMRALYRKMPCKMKMHLILLDGCDTASCVSVLGVCVGVFFWFVHLECGRAGERTRAIERERYSLHRKMNGLVYLMLAIWIYESTPKSVFSAHIVICKWVPVAGTETSIRSQTRRKRGRSRKKRAFHKETNSNKWDNSVANSWLTPFTVTIWLSKHRWQRRRRLRRQRWRWWCWWWKRFALRLCVKR